jgi:hypothetical protein
MDKTQTAEKTEVTHPSTARELQPAVRSWLENVLVPALVKLYLEENGVGSDRTPSQENGQERKR